ncbi:MAG: bile acid:sodium symporter family protein [Geodermatophilaceae bacterium]|nr:bile acid:sodium symporter family protein [Geodermatophilaceae bacterium]
MDSPAIAVGLPIALAIIMFGLGLSLTLSDFVRVGRSPKATVVALACQIILLPAVCFGLVIVVGLDPLLAVGMMLLVAAPGGTTANLFSYLAGGDVALNITLTAINSLLSVVTIPIVVNLSAQYFLGTDTELGLPPGEVLAVVAIVVVPVAIGMAVRNRAPSFADRMQRPVKIGSAVVLALVIVVALAGAWDVFVDNVLTVGSISLVLCSLGLALGYWVPRSIGVSRRQSIASSMEVGIQNATLAITIAVTLMDNTELAVAPAIYGLLMFFPAAVAGYLFARRSDQAAAGDVPAPDARK